MCDNATSPVVCEDAASITAFLASPTFRYFSAYILTKSVNFKPTDKDPTFKFINLDTFWLAFT